MFFVVALFFGCSSWLFLFVRCGCWARNPFFGIFRLFIYLNDGIFLLRPIHGALIFRVLAFQTFVLLFSLGCHRSLFCFPRPISSAPFIIGRWCVSVSHVFWSSSSASWCLGFAELVCSSLGVRVCFYHHLSVLIGHGLQVRIIRFCFDTSAKRFSIVSSSRLSFHLIT